MPQLVVKLKERELQVYPITKPCVTIGRDASNDLIIDNSGVSRMHASVNLEGRDLVVRDMASANGVYVNGRAVVAHPFRDGDQIQIGKFVVEYIDQGGPELDSIRGESDLFSRPRPSSLSPLETTHLKPEELLAAQRSGVLAIPSAAWPTDDVMTVPAPPAKSNAALRKTVVALSATTLSLAFAVLYLTFV
ncbi:MAG: FHA domain-containing protein [Myxococcota bacterium]